MVNLYNNLPSAKERGNAGLKSQKAGDLPTANPLSYLQIMVKMKEFEPLTSSLRSKPPEIPNLFSLG